MDIAGGYNRVPRFSAHLPESVLKVGNKESLKWSDEQNQNQQQAAPTHSTARYKIRSAKERQELLTRTNSFKYESSDKASRSFKVYKEDMPRDHSISSSTPDADVIDRRRPTLNQCINQRHQSKKADLSISAGTNHSTQKNQENVERPATTMRGRTEWRQIDMSNRSKSLDWRVSKRKGGQENQMDAISNTKNHEERSIQLSLMKKIELSTGSGTSSTAQKKPDSVESSTTKVKERTELKQVYLSNRSKSVDRGGQENCTNVCSNTKDLLERSIKCSESLKHSDTSIKPNAIELDNPLKKASLYIQPFSGHGQRKQDSNGVIFSPVSETLPFRTVAQSFPSRIKANISQERTEERKSPWYYGHSGVKPDQPDHHFRSQIPSSNISETTRKGTVTGNNARNVLEDSSDASSEVLHGMSAPVPFTKVYSTQPIHPEKPSRCSIDRMISVSSSSTSEKYGTFPKAPRKKERMNSFTVPDTSFVLPNGKGNSDTTSTFFKDKPLSQNLKSYQKSEGVLDKVQIPCLASVRNTIDKFEALAQQSQSSSGIQPPRRAFSVTEKPRVVPSLNKAYSDRSLGKRWGGWNREFLKEDLFSTSEFSNEAAAKKNVSRPDQTTSQDKEGSPRKTPTSGSKSMEPGVTQTSKQLEGLPSKQRNEKFTVLNKNLDEPDFFKGSQSFQPPKTSDSSENKVRNYLSSCNAQTFKDSEPKNKLSTKDNGFRNESTFLIQNLYSPTRVKTPSYLFSDSRVLPPIQGLGDLSNPYSSIKDKKGAEKVIRWIMDKGADDEIGEDGIDDEDDEGIERSYDSDSGESSVTITSNMSIRSFSMSLVDLCSLGGLDLPPQDSGGSKDEEDWLSKRTVSMSSDVSALSSVTLLDMDELECLLNDVRGLDDDALENYEDVHVVVLHKEAGSGVGFTVAGGVDQNKPVTVHKVLPNGIAAREGSIYEGDQVLSINGTALHNSTHKEALHTMKKARGRAMTVVVIRRGDVTETCYSLKDSTQKPVGISGCRIRVLLNKCSSDLGFSLEGGVGSTLGDKPITVQRLFQGGPVGKVFPGDELLEVEGQSLEGLRRLEVWQLIKRLPPGPVEVLLQRPYQQY